MDRQTIEYIAKWTADAIYDLKQDKFWCRAVRDNHRLDTPIRAFFNEVMPFLEIPEGIWHKNQPYYFWPNSFGNTLKSKPGEYASYLKLLLRYLKKAHGVKIEKFEVVRCYPDIFSDI